MKFIRRISVHATLWYYINVNAKLHKRHDVSILINATLYMRHVPTGRSPVCPQLEYTAYMASSLKNWILWNREYAENDLQMFAKC